MIGCGGLCEESLHRIFGGKLDDAVDKLSSMLNNLGISTRPVDHGVEETEWTAMVDDAFDGERGRNFTGERDRFLQAAAALWGNS